MSRQVNKVKEKIAEAAVEKLEDQGIIDEMACEVLDSVDIDLAADRLVSRLKDCVVEYGHNRPKTLMDSISEEVVKNIGLEEYLVEGAEDQVQDVVSDKIVDLIQENL